MIYLRDYVTKRIFSLGGEAKKRLSGELPRDEKRLRQIRLELNRLAKWLGGGE